jgi:ribosomal protein S8
MRIIRENDGSNVKTTNLTRKEFDKLLKQIADNSYCYSNLELTTDFLYGLLHADNTKIIKQLSNALKQNSYIKKLSLVNQNITNEGALALAEVDTLEEINLGHNDIFPNGVATIVQNNIKTLSLEHNDRIFNGEDEKVFEMIKTLNKNQTLTELNLCGTKIGNHYLAEIFANNTTIKILDLSQNHSYVQGLRPLEHNKTLEHLDLSKCRLTNEAAEIIAKNSGLHTLIIDESEITDKGGQYLSQHPTLKVLSIIDSNMTAEGLSCFLSSGLEKITPDNVKKNLITELELCEFFRQFDTRHHEDIEEVTIGEVSLPEAEIN